MYYFKLGQSSVHSIEYASQMFLVDCVISIMLGIILFVLFLILFLLLIAGVCKKLYVNFGRLELLCGVVPIFLLLLQVYYSYSNIRWDSEVYLDWGDSKK